MALLCPNPSPMTLEGTNTWVLAEPGSTQVIVVDPGPLDEAHLQAVLAHVAGRGARVTLTLLTHGHADHAESAPRWAELTGAPVRAVGRGHDDLAAGEVLRVGGLETLVVPTPGHTADSISFLLPAEQILLTGDTVLGRGTTVVAYPDGDLTSYLESLEHLRDLTGAGSVTSIAPGHGPIVPDAAGTIEYYLRHRHERLTQIRAAVTALREGTIAAGRGDLADQIVQTVYADVPKAVWPAARMSVLAQLDYLRER
ncbi:MAG: MBL fold metallo-hydrolase [Ornithinimicrobium sp.]|uniref:MBL fold metallo-hydrolase n=1 Tax=Ornithinimicrobium sp. TaxID=1977084 RepID=UPI0026DF776B|nr:MBL fold metallo-hydrolase [Ornithinimicrobium sp.]MDO5740662.1 MBL fold metallo-hydrolase [Ornithinimicrobium sp.]